MIKKNKSGINKAIICKKCGHRVGFVRIKSRFKLKMMFYIFVLAVITQLVADIISKTLLGN